MRLDRLVKAPRLPLSALPSIPGHAVVARLAIAALPSFQGTAHLMTSKDTLVARLGVFDFHRHSLLTASLGAGRLPCPPNAPTRAGDRDAAARNRHTAAGAGRGAENDSGSYRVPQLLRSW